MILDSNIIIYAVIPENQKLRDFLKQKESDLRISAITKLEVLGYHKLTNEELNLFNDFFKSITIYPINNLVIEKAIFLRQRKKISIGDSIIAATAITNNQLLLTNNVEDFTEISELQIISMKSVL